MQKLKDAPGSNNGTGLFQSLIALKLREIYRRKTAKTYEYKACQEIFWTKSISRKNDLKYEDKFQPYFQY